MSGILYEEANVWEFLFITFILGGWAAWMTGRACAKTWRSYTALFFSLLGLGIAVRFIHHALFEGTMFSPQFYLVDTVILMAFGFIGYRYTRTNQMVRQYGWLYERQNLLAWRDKA